MKAHNRQIGPLISVAIAFYLFSARPALALVGWLSQGSHFLRHGPCPSLDSERADAALRRVACSSVVGESAARTANEVRDIAGVVWRNPDDGFFQLLGRARVRETSCAADFAIGVASDSRRGDILSDRLVQARAARTEMKAASQRLARDPTLTARTCPATMEDLLRDWPEVRRSEPSFEACGDLIRSRTAFQTLTASIPLSTLPSVASLIDRFTNAPGDAPPDRALIHSTYAVAGF